MSDLLSRLQSSLGETYRIERELGGGGMSRVFLAQEGRLGRKVVIKVLPPETSVGVHADRFEREIQVAASLQHPHVVPLLTAGAAEHPGDDPLLYYVMPFIDGETLATRLAREGALPVPEVTRILRDVVDALVYAHSRGVVHRDIKPDNILFSGRHALVADFGVAKAVSISSGASPGTLTSHGVALGTPAYMAPEQAAADPNVDHRADLYAVGAVAYELLTGRTPFITSTPQAMLAAHVTATPDPVSLHRPAIPAELAALVMRCLEKHPADRWQSASELLGRLEAVATPSGGSTPAATTPVPAVRTSAELAVRRAHPLRVAGLFALATIAVTAVVYLATRAFGLPDWVWIVALGCMLAGLPVMLYTSRVERKRAQLRATGTLRFEPEPIHQQWFTWRRAFLGGAIALGILALLTGAYVTSKALGIGPARTLLSSGALAGGDQLVLADFTARNADSSLAETVTEALRVDLGQSSAIRLVDARAVTTTLERMGRTPGGMLDQATAREVALREGAKAVVVGEISALPEGYVLTAQLIRADSGTTLVPVRVTAASDAELIPAVNRLSAELREKIGESLGSIRGTDPLEKVTTASLPALQLYTRASRVFEQGDFDQARNLLLRAISMDSSFAMAWRKLSSAYFNLGIREDERLHAAEAAFRHRDRLPPLERYLTEATYYSAAERNTDSAIAAYRAALDVAPGDLTAGNNLGLMLNGEGRFAEAEAVLRPLVSEGKTMSPFINLQYALIAQSEWREADSLAALAATQFPDHPGRHMMPLDNARGRRDFALVDSILGGPALAGFAPAASGPGLFVIFARLGQHEVRGRLREAEAESRRLARLLDGGEDPTLAADLALLHATHLAYQLQRPQDVANELARALGRPELKDLPDSLIPFTTLADLHAILRNADEVRRLRRLDERFTPPELREERFTPTWDALEARAFGDWLRAAQLRSRIAAAAPCNPCGKFIAGAAWDRAGFPDSAEAWFRRGIDAGATVNEWEEATHYPMALRRLGELAETRGDRADALEWYGKFVDLWRDADPELQPQVAAVRERMRALTAEPRR